MGRTSAPAVVPTIAGRILRGENEDGVFAYRIAAYFEQGRLASDDHLNLLEEVDLDRVLRAVVELDEARVHLDDLGERVLGVLARQDLFLEPQQVQVELLVHERDLALDLDEGLGLLLDDVGLGEPLVLAAIDFAVVLLVLSLHFCQFLLLGLPLPPHCLVSVVIILFFQYITFILLPLYRKNTISIAPPPS